MSEELETERCLEATKTLGMMLDYLGLEAEITSDVKPGKINLFIASEDAGRIIGKKGQSLEAMQFLINRMLFESGKDQARIFINIDGYSSRNDKAGYQQFTAEDEEILKKQAEDAAKEVKKWGDAVVLPEMNSHQRRIVHITLEGSEDIQTESLGEGAKKNVQVSLKKED